MTAWLYTREDQKQRGDGYMDKLLLILEIIARLLEIILTILGMWF
ncbi:MULTISPECIES: hypothetical protein [Brevibacillus]|nr:hypothetical protein [Brevibacillus borstelensis]